MKKLISFILSLILVFSCFLSLSSCSNKTKSQEVKLTKNDRDLLCYDRLYESLETDLDIIYCGDSAILYTKKTQHPKFRGDPEYPEYYQLYTSGDNSVLSVVKNEDGSKNPQDFWGVEGSHYYVSDGQMNLYYSFLGGWFSSYRLLSCDPQNPYYIDLGQELKEGNYLLNSGWKDLKEFDLSQYPHYPIVGCDATGNFGVIIGYLIEEVTAGSFGQTNVYYYYVSTRYEDLPPSGVVIAYSLSGNGNKDCRELFANGERISPQFSTDTSLYQQYAKEYRKANAPYVIKVVILVSLCVVLFILCIVILCLFFGKKFLDWLCSPFVLIWDGLRCLGRKIAKLCYRIRYRKMLSRPIEDREPLRINLTKEEITRTLVEDTAGAEEDILRYCPRCGAKCDWSSLHCAACGVPLSVHGASKPVRYRGGNDAASERNIGPEGVLLDMSSITREEYIERFSPRKLKKFLKGNVIDYYSIVAWYGLGNLLVSGELIALTQSFLAGIISFAGVFVLLGFAIRYHKKKDLVSSIVVTAVSLVETISFLFGFGAIIDYYPLEMLIFTCFFGVLPLIASVFILVSAIQLEIGYREFRKGKLYQ